MLKILLKKQLMEIFRSYFYDSKKNRRRSKASTIGFLVMFFCIMVLLLGGMFTGLSAALCGPLTSAGMGWFYCTIMAMLALLLGIFGSVFSTYSSLYLSKDNDLLLSLPIPVRAIMASRLLGVYLMGLMYSAVVLLPAVIVYWVTCFLTPATVLGALLLIFSVSLIVMVLSCLLGWVVARVSLKLKNRSIVTVLTSLVTIGIYYLFCFRLQDLLQSVLANAVLYGQAVQGAAYPLYVLGQMGTGSYGAMALVTLLSLVLFLLVWALLSRSFLKIATSSGGGKRVRYQEKPLCARSPAQALLGKEFRRFLSSPNYMLNCGLGILLLPVMGVLLLVKSSAILPILSQIPGGTQTMTVILPLAICLVATMNDTAAPSVSLEGKTLWILQSLPVDPWPVLRAKLMMHLLLTEIPTVICCVLTAIAFPVSLPVLALSILLPVMYVLFTGVLGLALGLKLPNLTWTNETAPIKQSACVTIALLGGWAMVAVMGVLYFLAGRYLGAAIYLSILTVVVLAASLVLLHWLRRRGTVIFASL